MTLMASIYDSRVNEETRRVHRRQTFWQILLPVFLGVLLAISLIVLVIRSGESSVERSAQTATILLSIPLMVSGLVFLFLTIFLSSMLGRLMQWLPPRSYQAQRIARRISSGVEQVSHASQQPFLLLESWGEALGRIFQRIR
jgi:predicted PurR-regulated permease PerM